VIDKKTIEEYATMFIACSHPYNLMSVQWEAFDKQGEESFPGRTQQERPGTYVTFPAKLNEIGSIKLKYYADIERVIFRTPIPGLPEFNQDIDNLFDQRVPFLLVTHENEILDHVARMTQLEIDYPDGMSAPGGIFPKTYHNVSAAELLITADSFHTDRPMVVNLATGRIHPNRDPSWWDTAREKAEEWRGRIFGP
ncbi:MAG: hypothetical protein AAF585_22910, partial [Verrucomicrobiota bacterium]